METSGRRDQSAELSQLQEESSKNTIVIRSAAGGAEGEK